jgi:hypothetical protein
MIPSFIRNLVKEDFSYVLKCVAIVISKAGGYSMEVGLKGSEDDV